MVRSLKNPVTPPGIDPGTVRLVAQRLNHYATPGPPMKQSTSGKYDDQEDTRISWKPKVHHRTYNSPKRKPYPTSNGFNPHGHIPISTISLVHMATLLSVRIVTLLYLRPTQSTWPHSYVHDQFSPHDHTPISTNNPVHMATNLYLRTIQSTWPQSYIYDQFSPHGHILMSTVNSVHMTTLLYLRTIQSTWPQSYIYDQSSPHGHNPISTINPVHMATFLCPRSIQSTLSTLLFPQSKYCSSIYI